LKDVARQHGHVFEKLLIASGGSVYVCGDAVGMGKDVKEAFVEIFGRNSGTRRFFSLACLFHF
jgi:sulfite reductase alpha subunit-like flavoprotein